MHAFKDRFVSLLAIAGLPLPLVSEIAGHSKKTTTLNFQTHALLDEPPERTRAHGGANSYGLGEESLLGGVVGSNPA